MSTPPSSCRWETEILAHVYKGWPDFTMNVIVRRTDGPGEFDLRSTTHVLSLPLAGAEPLMEGRLGASQTAFAMQPGHALMRPAQQRFHGLSLGAGTFRYAMLSFAPELIARATAGTLDAATEVFPSADIANPSILWSLAALAGQAGEPGPGGRLYAESLATAVLIELVRERVIGDLAYRAAVGRSARALARFAEYVEAHLVDDLSLFTIAAEAGLSPAHLTREVKRVTGLAPHQYVLRRRAERARLLLDAGEHTIGEVAFAVGFASQAHLNLVFRRVYGMTPGGYRALRAR